jgi:predicted transcriptional regulator of viral defense system
MKFEELLTLLGGQGWFDLASAVQLSGQPGPGLVAQLHRWSKAGKLVPLRRGMYAFSEKYRRKRINVAQLANEIHAPSYLGLHWALGFYGLIPEKAVAFTSVTSRGPKTFSNAFGVFAYRHVKPTVFFGYRRVVIDGAPVLLADPEKALLDLWHLEPGAWNRARLSEMRFQNMEHVDPDRLADFAARFRSPRLMEAVRIWSELADEESKGMVEL